MAKEKKAQFTVIHPKAKKGFSKELMQWVNDPSIQHMDHIDFLYLIKVKVDYHIIEAALRFWDKNKEEFSFADNKLCPTLEEIAAIVVVPLNLDIYVPVHQSKYGNAWSKLFGCVSKDLYQSRSQFMTYKTLYEKGTAWRNLPYGRRWVDWKKMFELCLFGEVLLGRTNDNLNLSAPTLLNDFYNHRCIIPTLLAHLITKLNRKRFGDNMVILYIWLCEHSSTRVSRPPQTFNYEEGDIIPLSLKRTMYSHDKTSYATAIPERLKTNKWILFYQHEHKDKASNQWRNLTADKIIWIREWGAAQISRSFIIGMQLPGKPFTDILLLPMSNGTIVYQPYRFLRQFGYKQEVPLFERYDSELRVFRRDNKDIEEHITHMWRHAVHIKNYSPLKSSDKENEYRFKEEPSASYRMWIQGMSKISALSAPIEMTRARYEDMQATIRYLEGEIGMYKNKCESLEQAMKKRKEDTIIIEDDEPTISKRPKKIPKKVPTAKTRPKKTTKTKESAMKN